MPSWELFAEQSEEYRQRVLPPGVPRLAVEAGVTLGWRDIVGDSGAVIGIDRFWCVGAGRGGGGEVRTDGRGRGEESGRVGRGEVLAPV